MRALVLNHLRAMYVAGFEELRAGFDPTEAAGYNLDATGYLPQGSTVNTGAQLASGQALAFSHVRRPGDYRHFNTSGIF